jgi:hypothetical protein
MAAATLPEIDGKVTRFTSWHILPEEQYAKRMRTLRQLCVDSDGSQRDQFFKVLEQVDDWEWEDLNIAKLDEDQHVSNRTQSTLRAFALGTLVAGQSPPPGNVAASSSDAAAPTGTAFSATGWPTGPDTTFERLTNLAAQEKLDLIAKNKAIALKMREEKKAVDKLSSVSGEVPPTNGLHYC